MWWLNQKIAAMRVANDSRKTVFRLPSQMDSMVAKARTKSTVIILAEPVYSELLVVLGGQMEHIGNARVMNLFPRIHPTQR